MTNLISETPEAYSWFTFEKSRRQDNSVFGNLEPGVIWTDAPDVDGKPIGGADPSEMIAQINSEGWPLYRGHDPGFPSGRCIAAKLFVSPSGRKFVAAILGFYVNKLMLSFDDLGVDSHPEVSSPSVLDVIPNGWWLDIATDSREIDYRWLENVLCDSPLPVMQHELSHNAEDWQQELIRITLPYVLLVWNPFITTIAKEAAKDVYAGTRHWLSNLWSKLSSLKNPVVILQSHQNGCQVFFIVRGKDVKCNYAAHDAHPIAAAQAAELIHSMRARHVAPSELVYEFDQQNNLWFPSYARLEDGRLVSNRNILIAFEQHPNELSIGITLNEQERLDS